MVAMTSVIVRDGRPEHNDDSESAHSSKEAQLKRFYNEFGREGIEKSLESHVGEESDDWQADKSHYDSEQQKDDK